MTNDRYLFRGFHKDENGPETIYLDGKEIRGKWVYGFYVYDKYKHYIIYKNEDNSSYSVLMDGKFIEVISETVGQYTGLDDKNGKKIFENDVVKCKLIDQIKEKGKWVNKESYENYEVIYDDESLGFRFKDEWRTIWEFTNCELEIISTIFNKEVK